MSAVNRRSFLDEIDRKILHELQKNCQIPQSTLAKNMQVSLSTIHYRIKRLEDEEIIRGYHADIDLSTDQTEFLVTLLISAPCNEEKRQEILDFLQQQSEIWAAYSVWGKYDFVVHAKTPNHMSFANNLYSKLIQIGNIIHIETLGIHKIIKEEPRDILNLDES
ncbi:MAG: Lrp/AsnC family transcriptional regulator [Promethearchaeota archaeon]